MPFHSGRCFYPCHSNLLQGLFFLTMVIAWSGAADTHWAMGRTLNSSPEGRMLPIRHLCARLEEGVCTEVGAGVHGEEPV